VTRLLSLLAVAFAAAGLALAAPAAVVAAPNCDAPDAAPVCDSDPPVGEDPAGAVDSVTYAWGWETGAAQHTLTVSGWAADPDSRRPIDVRLDVVRFNGDSASLTAAADLNGHGFEIVFALPLWADALSGSFCVTALNVGGGADAVLGCGYWINN
jgi:hypothetical protein